MNRRSTMNRLRLVALAGVVGFSFSSMAADPGAKKPEPRLPPTGSQTTDIPSGVDTGTSATSNSLPLGTPIPPSISADRGDQNKRSAAARAAARPASSGLGPRIDTAPAEPTVPVAGQAKVGVTTSPAATREEVLKATTPPPRVPRTSRRKAASDV